jgi:hypothetical protein
VGKKVIIHEDGLAELMAENPELRGVLWQVGNKVAAAAASTASAAEKGPGGRITGYADAGFSVEWHKGNPGRPGVRIVANADMKTVMAVYWYTQKRDGETHMRAALRSQT